MAILIPLGETMYIKLSYFIRITKSEQLAKKVLEPL